VLKVLVLRFSKVLQVQQLESPRNNSPDLKVGPTNDTGPQSAPSAEP